MATGTGSTFALKRDDDGSVVTVELQRPHCLDVAAKRDLTEMFASLAGDDRVRAVILASADPLAMLVDVSELARMTPATALHYSRAGQRLMGAMEAVPAPIIAAVSGAALGGGCEAEAKRILTGSSGREPGVADAMEQAAFAAMFGTADQHARMDAFLAAQQDGGARGS